MEEWLEKCLSCKHSYHRNDDADIIYCRCRNGKCNYFWQILKEGE